MNPVKFSIHNKLKICTPLLAVLAVSIYPSIANAGSTTIFKCLDAKGKPLYSDDNAAARTICSANTLTTTVKTPAPVPAKTTTATASNPNKLVTDTIFSPTSPWYTPIPTKVTLASNSVALVKNFVAQTGSNSGLVPVNTWWYSAPQYIAGKDVKPVKVEFHDCQKKGYADKKFVAMMASVPIPQAAKTAVGTLDANGLPQMGMKSDYEIAIYQPSTDTYYDLWKATQLASGQWVACWGGKIENASTSTGTFDKYYGVSASGFAFMAGQITAEELKRGEIKHALGLSVKSAAHWNVFSWPANRSDGWNPNNLPNQIAEGQRFRLDPTIDVDKLNMTRAGKIIAKAAQKYGFIVWDTAGTVSLRAAAPQGYLFKGEKDPYPELYENRTQSKVLTGFPWDKLQFLPMDYGKK